MDYKITFNISSPMCFFERPMFDSIIAYAYVMDKHGVNLFTPLSYTKEEQSIIDNIPITKFKNRYYLASSMMYDDTNILNNINSKKKRWDSNYDFLASFGKSKRQLDTKRGTFRSYDIAYEEKLIDKVWFYVNTDNIGYIVQLLSNYIFGIGKNIKLGHGEIKDYNILKLNSDDIFEKKLLRPIPVDMGLTDEQLKCKYIIRHFGYYPPYWNSINQDMCYYPKLSNVE